jgi:Flp pilus assembly protein TadB
MAQTRKKRKRRHRGNAAGIVEARGRTTRPTGARTSGSASKKKPANRDEARQQARDRRANRFDEPPSWRSALNRSLFAAGLFGISIVLLFHRPIISGVALAAVMILLYWPMSYYTDSFLYNRRQRQKKAGSG